MANCNQNEFCKWWLNKSFWTFTKIFVRDAVRHVLFNKLLCTSARRILLPKFFVSVLNDLQICSSKIQFEFSFQKSWTSCQIVTENVHFFRTKVREKPDEILTWCLWVWRKTLEKSTSPFFLPFSNGHIVLENRPLWDQKPSHIHNKKSIECCNKNNWGFPSSSWNPEFRNQSWYTLNRRKYSVILKW